jgi:hypothetical protein
LVLLLLSHKKNLGMVGGFVALFVGLTARIIVIPAPGIFVFDVLQGVHAGACFTSGGIVDEGKARPMTGSLTEAINERTVGIAGTSM